MREVAFIKQNKEKWLEVEAILSEQQRISPDQMADNYIQLLGDLSFSQTYYPKSNTTVYLNFLVSQIYQKIYKTKRVDKNRFSFFFTEEVPMLLHKHRKVIYFAFILFFFFMVIGALSAHYQPSYARATLGDEYINMTLDNIEKGDPMAVYKSGGNWSSFIAITVNNIRIAFNAYLYALSAGILTFFIAMKNGIMVGVFQYFCYQAGALQASLRAIWLHGAMEIFSIVIATAAGFVLALSVLIPKTFSRILSFKIGFRESFYIFLATLPFFIAAGFIEGFITRYYYDMPLVLNIIIILGTLSVISYYFLIYPIIKHYKSK